MSEPIADATEDPTLGSMDQTVFPEDEFPDPDQNPDLVLHDFDEMLREDED